MLCRTTQINNYNTRGKLNSIDSTCILKYTFEEQLLQQKLVLEACNIIQECAGVVIQYTDQQQRLYESRAS